MAQTEFNVEEEWKQFKEKFGRKFETEEEEKRRFEIFRKNVEEMAEHNKKYEKGELSWYKGVNQFADLTSDEFKNRCCGATYNKSYATAEEEKRRFDIFRKSIDEIRSHNEKYVKGEETSYKGVNEFADLTNEEWEKTYCGHMDPGL